MVHPVSLENPGLKTGGGDPTSKSVMPRRLSEA